VVAPGSGYKTVADLIAAAKAKPGALNFGSAGTGSGTHINAEKFRLAAGIDVVHIPYKGTPEALTDTMTGRITYFFSPISAALPHVKEGKLVALGVSTAKRSSALPSVPTIAESGLPGFDYNLWVGLFAPAGTPPDVVARIAADTAKALQTAEVKERLAALGADPMPMTPPEFTKFVDTEIEDSGKVIRAANIKVQ
jgi:tripartite-type tricarboxylate transporter receptor subunit TctC